MTPKQIKFFSNGTVDNIIDVELIHMNAVAYDPIKQDIYVSDSKMVIGSIFRIKTTEKSAYNVPEPIVASTSRILCANGHA